MSCPHCGMPMVGNRDKGWECGSYAAETEGVDKPYQSPACREIIRLNERVRVREEECKLLREGIIVDSIDDDPFARRFPRIVAALNSPTGGNGETMSEPTETTREWVSRLREDGEIREDAVLLEGSELDAAILGVGDERIVYSVEKLLELLPGDTQEEREEWFSYNTLRTLPYMGEGRPILLREYRGDLL